MPKISICAPCYNHEKFIPAFMESLLAQGFQDWELIVVDDCSSDGSFEILQRYGSMDRRIRTIRNDRNRHVCATVNRALSMASGDLIVMLSCDDIFLPGKLDYDTAYFRDHPDIIALCAIPQVFSEDGSRCPDYTMPDDFDRHRLLRMQLFSRNVLLSPGLVIRHEALRRIGGHDNMLRMTQDHEFLTRILEHGPIGKSDRPTVGYRRHANNLSSERPSYLHAIANETAYFLSRHYLNGIKKVEDLLRIVPECEEYGVPKERTIPYFMARHAIERGATLNIRFAGLMAMYQFLQTESNRRELETDCDFIPKDFMMMSELPVFATAEELRRARFSVERMERSVSYRLGLALTSPLRRIYRMVKPLDGEE